MFTQGLRKEGEIVELSHGLCDRVCPGARKRGARVFFMISAADAESVWLVGSFNGWGNSHPLSRTPSGTWETSLSVSEIKDGDAYKFKICASGCEIYVTDPYAVENDGPPHFNSVYRDISDELPHTYENEDHVGCLGIPVNIYEIRTDKWSSGNGAARYGEMANETLPYILQMGYTHICLSGVYENYYDHAHTRGEQAYFAPHREQGGIDELRELVHSMHALGVGVLLDWRISHVPEEVAGERFLIDNALYWLDIYGIDGFMIGGDATDADTLSRIIDAIKSEKTEAYFIAREVDSNARIAGVDAVVKDCDALCSMLATPKNDADRLRMKMAARAYLAFLEGRMTTCMGCEIGQARWDAEEIGIDAALADKRENACLQLFVSDLNSLYLSRSCLWQSDRRIRMLSGYEDSGIAVLECSCEDGRLVLAVDLSGRGGDTYLPEYEGLSLLLSSCAQRYGGEEREVFSKNSRGAVVTLQSYGVAVLG